METHITSLPHNRQSVLGYAPLKPAEIRIGAPAAATAGNPSSEWRYVPVRRF